MKNINWYKKQFCIWGSVSCDLELLVTVIEKTTFEKSTPKGPKPSRFLMNSTPTNHRNPMMHPSSTVTRPPLLEGALSPLPRLFKTCARYLLKFTPKRYRWFGVISDVHINPARLPPPRPPSFLPAPAQPCPLCPGPAPRLSPAAAPALPLPTPAPLSGDAGDNAEFVCLPRCDPSHDVGALIA